MLWDTAVVTWRRFPVVAMNFYSFNTDFQSHPFHWEIFKLPHWHRLSSHIFISNFPSACFTCSFSFWVLLAGLSSAWIWHKEGP